tara:strand:- start:104 stop:436 length:333 start_codon:yes stop_codon:yes gene_type:complete
MTTIDWNLVEETRNAESAVTLKDAEMEREYLFSFRRVFQTESGAVGAEVEVKDLEGNLLWLSGEYGPSNGFDSLKKAVGGNPDDIQDATVTYVRVASEKSPAGYAHSWRA